MGFFDGGGGDFLGNVIGTAGSIWSSERQMDFQAEQYAKRYQTMVKDLKAAGLSPMLAFPQGAGSSPSGTSINVQNPLSGVASSARERERLDAEIKNLEETNKQIRSSTALNHAYAKGANVNTALAATNLPEATAKGNIISEMINSADRLRKEADVNRFEDLFGAGDRLLGKFFGKGPK